MADIVNLTIADLPEQKAVTDDTLIPVWQPGAVNEAQSMTGKQFREFAEQCVAPYSAAAKADAVLAEIAKTAAQSALSGVQNAIKNIPAGSTPIVNDLTTGGATMALSAEQGKALNQRISGLTAADIGAMENKGWLSSYSTVLSAATLASKAGYSFFAVANGGALINAADAPFGAVETQYVVIVDAAQAQRRTVLAFRYGTGEVATRDIFNDSWLTEWSEIATTDKVLTVKTSGKAAVEKLRTVDDVQYRASFGISDNGGSPYSVMDIKDDTNNGSNWGIGVSVKEKKPIFYEYSGGIFAVKDIHHTGNKPSGRYTGNGSNAYREIPVGGFGQLIVIWSEHGFALMTRSGSICYTAEGVVAVPTSEGLYNTDLSQVQMASMRDVINKNGVTYNYQVL